MTHQITKIGPEDCREGPWHETRAPVEHDAAHALLDTGKCINFLVEKWCWAFADLQQKFHTEIYRHKSWITRIQFVSNVKRN